MTHKGKRARLAEKAERRETVQSIRQAARTGTLRDAVEKSEA